MIGFLNVEKPSGITSHDLVNEVRRATALRQVGHGGTLDPLASGVMVVALGKATRLLRFVPDDKVYLATILLGTTTDSDDTDGKVLSTTDVVDVDRVRVEEFLSKFVGKQLQVPPKYSAIKKGGMKLYELARRGEAPDNIEAREVEFFSLTVEKFELPHVQVRVHCSKGTYIRSLARDLGGMLSVGGCLSALVRERHGPLALSNSVSLSALKEMRDKEGSVEKNVTPIDEVVALPCLSLDADLIRRLACGQTLETDGIGLVPSEYYLVKLLERPAMVVKFIEDAKILKPEVVLVDAQEI
ncbi:MAG: tRNA pseudouridine(55) synthase TruB [Cyanobacteria bacterium]|nr:tRNA pseudouridine(55) synthase TruB [Cyanobacteriota bacterium]